MFAYVKATAIAAAIILPTLAALPALAADGQITMDTLLGTTMTDVTATLSGMGYEVRKAETENGKMEIYVVGNGQMGEVYVSTTTGKPTKIEIK